MTYANLKITAFDNKIAATGNAEILRTLSKIDYARRGEVLDTGTYIVTPYIAFPPSRKSIMALESLCVPTSVTEEYVKLRNETMRIPVSQTLKDDNTILRRPMMQHQLEFVSFAREKRGTYNGSEQGTGKTMAACFLVDAWKAPINIVLCPSSLMLQWKEEFVNLYCEEYSNDMYNIIVLNQSSVAQRIKYLDDNLVSPTDGRLNIIITNYESLDKMKIHFMPLMPRHMYYCDSVHRKPAVIIADESWKIKNPKAKCGIAARQLAYECDHVLALSGTPVCQGVSDLWAQLDFITSCEGEQMESIELFCARYEVPTLAYIGSRTVSKPGPCSDPMGLMDRLEPVFYRATKASALDLPEKFPTEKVILDFSAPVRKLYNDIRKDGITAINPLLLESNTVTQIRLQQMCGGWLYNAGFEPGTLINEDAFMENLFNLTSTGEMVPIETPKTQWIERFCEDTLCENPQTRCIVWFTFNIELLDVAAKLEHMLGKGKVAVVHGKDKHSDEELAGIKDSFNSKNPDGVQVICAQIAKLAFGHNLQGCDINVYYSHTHKYVMKAQSQDRSHRMGRVGGVRYVELLCRDTIDETIVKATDNLTDMNLRLSPDTTSSVKEL